jgi:hypothetical protein
MRPAAALVARLATRAFITVNGKQYRTMTHRNGEYRFFYLPSGRAQVRVNTTARTVTLGDARVRQDFTLPAPTPAARYPKQ